MEDVGGPRARGPRAAVDAAREAHQRRLGQRPSGVSWPFSTSMGTEPITEARLLWVATPPTVWVRNAATRSRAVISSFSTTPPSNR